MTTCGENDPALVINALKQDIENVTDELWAAVGKVDVVGQLNIDSYCKGGNQLDAFIEGSRELALLLSTSLSSISRVTAYLECEKIHDLYASAVNGSLCSDAVDAAAWSLLFFFILGVSSMIMVTLRASWKQRVADEKIYDESEVAENMFVDEHEEYLAYISKYKQEWEVRTLNIFMSLSFSLSRKFTVILLCNLASKWQKEYQGLDSDFDAEPPLPQKSTGSSENSSSSESNTAVSQNRPVLKNTSSAVEAFDPYNSSAETHSQVSASASVDNISFLSLNVNSPQYDLHSKAIAIPSPMLSDRSLIEYDAQSALSVNDLMSSSEESFEKSTPLKPNYKMVPLRKSWYPTNNRSQGTNSLQNADDLLRRLDEIGSPLGRPPLLTPFCPSLSSDSFSSVEFVQ